MSQKRTRPNVTQEEREILSEALVVLLGLLNNDICPERLRQDPEGYLAAFQYRKDVKRLQKKFR